jgi:hypothetical protein
MPPLKHEVIDGYKICNICGENWPVSEYHPDKRLKSGIVGHCKDCRRERDRAIPPKVNKMFKIKKKYGLTEEQYYALIAGQGGRCAICGTNFSELKERHVHVDHDHKTNKVRGILCTRCNVGLGYFRDDPVLLEHAIYYLGET